MQLFLLSQKPDESSNSFNLSSLQLSHINPFSSVSFLCGLFSSPKIPPLGELPVPVLELFTAQMLLGLYIITTTGISHLPPVSKAVFISSSFPALLHKGEGQKPEERQEPGEVIFHKNLTKGWSFSLSFPSSSVFPVFNKGR